MILKSLATAASFASRHELTLLLLLSPLMLFSSRLSLIPLVLIPALWFSRWLATGRVTRRTGLEWPILALLLLVPVSLWVSVDPQTSLPRLSVLILGLAIFYAIANSANAGKRLSALTAMMLSLGFLVAVAGVTGMEGVKKAPVVGTLQVRMAESRGVSELLGRSFNANEVGGTLAMLIPFALAILVFPASKKLKTLAGISLAFMLLAAVFSQSRWSFVALAAASLAVLALRNRWCWLALPAMGLASVFLVWAVGPGKVLASFGSVASTDSVVGRLEIWERALYLIQDFPLTGVGLNTFVPATQRLYPYFTIPDVNLGHAHNLLLQLGADFGIPGIAVVATFFACLLFLWKAGLRFARGSQLEGAYVGFLGMLIAYLVFGLIDARQGEIL
ncbi:MAG: O-antigen ligase family protein, partial [Chloroflexi bacterium]|nr:O-antigen ligase family protein [Chloroflexota bacterium]